MGKGIAARQRAKRALRANQGNLHKASYGKATASLPLPNAPKPGELQIDAMPASMRKFMALKAATTQQGQRPIGSAPVATRTKVGKQRNVGLQEGDKQQPSQDGPSTSGRTEQTEQANGRKSNNLPDTSLGRGRSVFDALDSKKVLKARKKEYLKKKASKKKKGAKGGDVDVDEVEEGQRHDKIAFGETVSQPLQVNLKRKHWAPSQDKSASERCNAIFKKQLENATARASGSGGSIDHNATADDRRPSKAAQRSLLAQKRQMQEEEEKAQLRLQVVDAYRAQKRRPGTGFNHDRSTGAGGDGGGGGGATLDSLAKLVKAKPVYHTLA